MNRICSSFKPSNKTDIIPYMNKDGFVIYECKNCGHRFLKIEDLENHTNHVYSDGYFFEGGHGYPNYLEQKDILMQYGINYSNVLKKYCEVGSLLDVGCAAGFILKGYECEGWKCFGIDPNDTMIQYGRNVLNLNLKKGDLESFESDERFDLISLIQVIGHLHDLDKSLESIRNLTVDNGHVIVESWDMDSMNAKILGKYWHEYSPPSVVSWFSDATLTHLFSNHGFKLIASGRPSKKIKINHGIALLKKNTPNFFLKDKTLKFLDEKLGKFTLPYPPLDLKWYLFKKNLIINDLLEI